MSCWRTYSCDVLKNVDKSMVEEAMKKMGLGLNLSTNHIHGRYENGDADVDAGIIKNGQALDLGIVFDDGSGHLKVVGDFWNTGLNDATFIDELSREYQRINIETQAELNGWTIDETSAVENEDGSVEFELYQYA